MNEPNPFTQFSNILCISLKRSKERRQYIRHEFKRIGVLAYQFVDAYDKSSKEVKDVYESDRVAKFPPCFRCGEDECNCKNKRLFHAQIGNWLSHKKAWGKAHSNSPDLTLICEDDVKFQNSAHQSLQLVAESAEINDCLHKNEPVLIRFGWALCDDHQFSGHPQLTKQIKMSNPCYAINDAMSHLLLASLKTITTTSDIYIHKIIGSDVNHFTVMPPLAYEMSWSTGEFLSEIRPKQIRVNHLLSRLENMEKSDPKYKIIKVMLENERQRISQYEKFNSFPAHGYNDKPDEF